MIHSGTFRASLEGLATMIHVGKSVTIEPDLYHTFHNNSDSEPLVVSTGLDPLERER